MDPGQASAALQAVDILPPVGVYLIDGRFPADINNHVKFLLPPKYRAPFRHQSVYTRGWCFDITSGLAGHSSQYTSRSSNGHLPSVVLRIQRLHHGSNSPQSPTPDHLYDAQRVGHTVLPVWLLTDIARRIVDAMGCYNYALSNCNTFTHAFIQCIVDPSSRTGWWSVEPAWKVLTIDALEQWDECYIRGISNGAPSRLFLPNVGMSITIAEIWLDAVFKKLNRGMNSLMKKIWFDFYSKYVSEMGMTCPCSSNSSLHLSFDIV